jgi:hypothetical protein
MEERFSMLMGNLEVMQIPFRHFRRQVGSQATTGSSPLIVDQASYLLDKPAPHAKLPPWKSSP